MPATTQSLYPRNFLVQLAQGDNFPSGGWDMAILMSDVSRGPQAPKQAWGRALWELQYPWETTQMAEEAALQVSVKGTWFG